MRSRIKRSIGKSCGGFLALGNLVSFVTSRLPVDVLFLPKCVRSPVALAAGFPRACRFRISCSGVVGALFESPPTDTPTATVAAIGRRRGYGCTGAAAALSSRHITVKGPLFCDAQQTFY